MSAILPPELKVASKIDFLAGLLFAAIGLLALLLSQRYSIGTPAQMGPGYYPRVLSVVLLGLGAIIVLRALKREGPEHRGFALRPLALVISSVVGFALLLNVAGIAVAGAVLIVGSRLAGRDFRWREVLLLALVLVAGAVLVFGYGLAIPFKLWPWSV